MEPCNSTKHVLEGRELIDYLVEKTSSTANAELLRREERRNRRMTVLLSLLMAVGVGGVIGALRMFVDEQMEGVRAHVQEMTDNLQVYSDRQRELLKQEMDNRVAGAVAAKVDSEVGSVRRMLQQYKQYQELLALSEVIAAEVKQGKLPKTALATSLKLVDQLATSSDIISQPRFLEAVKVVIDLLVRTDRKSDINQLEQSLNEVFVTDSKIALDLADHYGQLIVASPYPVEQLEQYIKPFSRYTRACRELNYPEKALLWEMFVAFRQNNFQPSPVTDRMVEMIQDLNDQDTDSFCRNLFLNSHPLHWMNQPDQEGRQLAKLVQGLLDHYPTLRQTMEARLLGPGLQEWAEAVVARKTERLQKLGPMQVPETAAVAEEKDHDSNTLRR